MRSLRAAPLLIAMVLGCSSSGEPTSGRDATSSTSSAASCLPGQQVACACGGGVEGFQTCNAEGNGYGACSCGGAGGAGGVASASTSAGGAGGMASSSAATGGAGGAGGTGGGSVSTSGVGGAGGAGGGVGGGGGATFCTPGATLPCYDGPAGTENMGTCVAGAKTCLLDGSAYGPCMGQVLPTAETCSTAVDDDCDGLANEEGADCGCTPGTTRACYSGAASTENVGICHGGLQLCQADGLGYGLCGGELLPQSDDCATLEDENCDGVNASCNVGLCLWSKVFTTVSGMRLDAVTTDAAGNIVIAGDYGGAPDFGGGPLPSGVGLLVVKLDLAGNHVWSRGFTGFASMTAYDVAIDAAGNVLVAGGYNNTLAGDVGGGPLTANKTDAGFVAKYDAAGNHLWSKGYAGKVECRGIGLDSAGNVFVTGSTQGTVDFGGGSLVAPSGNTDSAFGLKLDANGQHVWSKIFSVTTGFTGHALAVDAAGDVWITSAGYGTIDFGGGPLTPPAGAEVALAKLTGGGGHLFSTLLGVGVGSGLVVDPLGAVVFTGYFSGSIDFGGGPLTSAGSNDFFLAKLDGAGGHVWSKRFGDAGSQIGIKVDANAAGDLVLGGRLLGSANFGGGSVTEAGTGDAFAAKLDAQGGHIFSKAFGDSSGQAAADVAIDDFGSTVVVGNLFGTMNLGCGTLTGAAQQAAFIAKLSP